MTLLKRRHFHFTTWLSAAPIRAQLIQGNRDLHFWDYRAKGNLCQIHSWRDVTNAQVQAHGKTLLREAKKGRHRAWTNKCFCVADGTQTTHKLFCVWLRKIAKHTQREICSNWNWESAIHRPEIKYAFILHVSRQIWVNILSSTSYFSSKNVKRKTKVSPALNFWYFF